MPVIGAAVAVPRGLVASAVAPAGAIAAGLLIDRLAGEPPARVHPVVWFGSAMTALEQRIHADRRSSGVVYTAAGVALGAGSGWLLQRAVGRTAATAVALAVASAGRMLDEEAERIGAHLRATDLDGARRAVRSLVGRDVEELDEAGVGRAVIESVAENTVDAVTAPVLWAAVGGAPAVLAHRAVNTMDAMVGHRTDRYGRFGWASARLDDGANWLPARLTALVVLAGPGAHTAAGRRATTRTVVRQAAPHPSPNGGLVEAAFAHALGVRLGGRNRYADRFEDRGEVGCGAPPTHADVAAAVALRRTATRRVAATVAVAHVAVRVVVSRARGRGR